MSKLTVFILYFLYMTVAATVIPLPTEPAPVYLGQMYSPLVVAALGALGDTAATLIEYRLFFVLFRRGKLRWLVRSKKISWLKKKVKNHLTWAAFVGNAFGVFPSDAVRILAILNRHNPVVLCVAVFAGRLPRYYALALLGEYFEIPFHLVAALFAVMLLGGLYHAVKEKRLIAL